MADHTLRIEAAEALVVTRRKKSLSVAKIAVGGVELFCLIGRCVIIALIIITSSGGDGHTRSRLKDAHAGIGWWRTAQSWPSGATLSIIVSLD